MNEAINLDTLADKIVKRLKASKSEYLMTASDVALFLGFAPGSASIQRIIADKAFPPSVQLAPGGTRRWRRADVQEWIDQRFGEDGKG